MVVVTPSEHAFEQSSWGARVGFRELQIKRSATIDTFGSYILTVRASKPCNRLGPVASSFKNSSISVAKILDWISWDEAAVTRLASSIPKSTDRKSSAAGVTELLATRATRRKFVSFLPYVYTRMFATRLILVRTEREKERENIVDGCFLIAFGSSTLRRWSTAVKRRKEDRNERKGAQSERD